MLQYSDEFVCRYQDKLNLVEAKTSRKDKTPIVLPFPDRNNVMRSKRYKVIPKSLQIIIYDNQDIDDDSHGFHFTILVEGCRKVVTMLPSGRMIMANQVGTTYLGEHEAWGHSILEVAKLRLKLVRGKNVQKKPKNTIWRFPKSDGIIKQGDGFEPIPGSFKKIGNHFSKTFLHCVFRDGAYRPLLCAGEEGLIFF